jgi:hypothetical protein
MCLGGGGGGKSAEEFYEEMRVEPEPLPSLPTGGERVERDQRAGMRRVSKPKVTRTGQTQRTLLNVYGGDNG